MTSHPTNAIFSLPSFAIDVLENGDVLQNLSFLPPQAARFPHSDLGKAVFDWLWAWEKNPAFHAPLPLAVCGTLFQQKVWEAIAAIPFGQRLSYGALATKIGSGARAVGNACGANPFPLIVPCHRVIAAGGKLGGFHCARDGFLMDAKKWLLERERAHHE